MSDRKRWIRFCTWVMLLALCVSAFVSCGNADVPDTSDPSDMDGDTPSVDVGSDEKEDAAKDEEDAKPLTPNDAVLMTIHKKTDYVIVYDDGADAETVSMIKSFKNRFWGVTGAELTLRTDAEPSMGKEILVYTMDGRNEVSETFSKLESPIDQGYYIELKGEKVVVACREKVYLKLALELLCSAVSEYAEGVYGLPRDYVGKLDIPDPIRGWRSQIQSFYTGENNYTLSVNTVTKKNYTDYCAVLEETFTLYSTNRIGDNLFATYVRDDERGRMAVYTMYYPNDRCYKITYGPLGYLPSLTATAEGDATVTPSITQNARGGSVGNGMCSIVQLTDGRFLVFDGGPYSSAENSPSKDDVKNLYLLLKEMTPGEGKPVIAGWFFSHAHSDHMQLAVAFVKEYHEEVELQMVGQNFPDFDSVQIMYESVSGMKKWVDAFHEALDLYYPRAKTWVVHTGEVLELPGCKLEVVYTPEDYATNPQLGALTDGVIRFPWGNHSCAIFRLTVNTTTFLVLGDAEKTLCKWMADNYGTAMKSDILSLSHHGLNGGELSFYQYIDPDICFWPTCTATMVSEKCTKHDFNKYLLNIGGYGTRDREHYPADVTTTIYC